MPNIPKHVKAHQIELFLKTNRPFTIVENINAARLISPQQSPYVQKNRLYRIIADGIKDALDQIHKLIGPLPVGYKNEMLQTEAVRFFREYQLQVLLDASYKRKPFDQEEFDHYSHLLNEATRGIITMMPEFRSLIIPHVDALNTTLTCLSEFGKAHHLGKMIPEFKTPAAPKDDPKIPESKNPNN